jgi:hypothetical protein
VVDGLDEEDAESLELIQEKLSQLSDTPLGDAAMKAAAKKSRGAEARPN